MSSPLALSNQLCFPIYALSKEITNMYRPLLQELDLTYPQYLVMIVLWEHQQLAVKQIGELLYLDSGTLTPLLKRLEAKQLVTRTRSTTDERIVAITLTELGAQLEQKALCIPAKLVEQINISTEELKQFQQIIHKIINK